MVHTPLYPVFKIPKQNLKGKFERTKSAFDLYKKVNKILGMKEPQSYHFTARGRLQTFKSYKENYRPRASFLSETLDK